MLLSKCKLATEFVSIDSTNQSDKYKKYLKFLHSNSPEVYSEQIIPLLSDLRCFNSLTGQSWQKVF